MMKQYFGGASALVLVLLMSACAPLNGMAQTTSSNSMAPPATSAASSSMAEKEDAMMAPDFEMQDLEGNMVKLSDFAGKAVYVKYWASWCPICLGGLEDLNTLAGEENNFQILTIVSPGAKGEKSTEDFKTWFAGVENTENITVLLDEKGTYTAAAGVRGYPTSEWIDEAGNILAIAPGHKDNEMIRAGFLG